MIVIGSHALSLHGIRLRADIRDLDLIGGADDVEQFRRRHRTAIAAERVVHGHRHAFEMNAGFPFAKVEIDAEGSESDRMLEALSPTTIDLLGMPARLPSVESLFLIKRAHANVPNHYEKTVRDLCTLKTNGLVGDFSDAQRAFLRQRKDECLERFNLNRQRFKLSVPNDDFFALSDHIRVYVHDDLHEVVAFEPGKPLYKRCKRDLSLARIDVDLFEQLSFPDRLRMVQEEFMVIGLERFYQHDRSLSLPAVYDKGMHKTIRDLFVGYFQDFCIDQIEHLVQPPRRDFIARFEQAERAGRLRKLELAPPPVTDVHRRAMRAVREGRLGEARGIAEDLIRRSPVGNDPHAYYVLGLLQIREKALPKAETCFRRSLARDKTNGACWFQLGALYRVTGRPREARECLEKAASLGQREFRLFFYLGQVCETERDTAAATQAYRKALEIRPDDPQALARIQALEASTGGTADGSIG